MKVGIITDVKNMGREALIQTWALHKIIKEFEAVPVVVNHRLEEVKKEVQPEQKTGIANRFKGIFAKTENTKVEEVVTKQTPEFIVSRFSLVEGNQEGKEDLGVYQHLDYYLTHEKKVWEALENGPIDAYPGVFFVNDAGVLINQKIYHELAIKPKLIQKYLFVDIEKMNTKTRDFIEKIAKEKGLAIVHNDAENKINKTVATYKDDEVETYIGYVWNAELVITDTMAGTLMAALHEKNFVTISDNPEIVNLLKQLKLSNHLLANVEAYQGESNFLLHNKPAFRKAVQEYRTSIIEDLKSKLHLDESSAMVDCPTNILKSECCGCSACKEVCPKDAITMKEDVEGFLYPVVDKDKCINCNLCAKVCVKKENPQTVAYEENYPKILAAMNKDEEVRLGSSSGAIFPELVKYAINEKHGYVVGVKYDDKMQVVSDIADNLEDCKAFYGAKYAKSDFSGVFPRIKELLNKGEFVLYSGLPCEAAALKAYLRKPYENLLICEILCHASPSPKVFRKYVEYLGNKFNSEVTNFRFRDKSVGWLAQHNSIVVEFKNRDPLKVNARRNNYYRSFAKDIIARPGCGKCSFVYKNRVGDITMGDFWGIQHSDPTMYDNKGTSVLMVNTSKGEEVWNFISDNFIYKESDLVTAFKYNHKKPIVIKDERHEFFKKIEKVEINALLESYNDLKK
ncbi:Coenzyme F420 hydrogenase/dehydrogenase, beta subunit C-terminal domain [Clostridium sp. Marseille-P299]|uniref:Coenzyme F420 hydrogenase/dehydrogenase, beta subunit C-terminal domain n=1 Tax=Clostridium sp. Marseille-P299 TaxID=1805477 RepID=UPI00082CE5C4|nr:Coenzyme F420 hydrogenase/dehydrogenase, beta subunit C-terminal domain [Clostridium sp. Marseille-P299]